MSDGDALLSAILAEPDEDVPRLAYADWLDEHGDAPARARAELIRVQVELARVPPEERRLSNPLVLPLLARETQLLTANHGAWLAPLREPGEPFHDVSSHGLFRRGFVEVVWMPAAWFVSRAEVLFARVPARELRVTKTTPAEFATLAHSPFFARLRALDLSDRRLGDAMVRTLTRSAASSLTELRLRGCALSDTAAYWLADAEFDWPLAELDVMYNPIGPAGLAALRERFGAGVVVASPPKE